MWNGETSVVSCEWFANLGSTTSGTKDREDAVPGGISEIGGPKVVRGGVREEPPIVLVREMGRESD